MTINILLSEWGRIRAKLMETIDNLQEEDLAFRPFEGSWTVRELLVHIAHEEMGEFRYGILQELDQWPAAYAVEEYTSISSIKGLLEQVHKPVVAYLKTLADSDLERTVDAPWGNSYRLGEMIGHIVEHEIHHRGELSLILGLLGRPAPDV